MKTNKQLIKDYLYNQRQEIESCREANYRDLATAIITDEYMHKCFLNTQRRIEYLNGEIQQINQMLDFIELLED